MTKRKDFRRGRAKEERQRSRSRSKFNPSKHHPLTFVILIGVLLLLCILIVLAASRCSALETQGDEGELEEATEVVGGSIEEATEEEINIETPPSSSENQAEETTTVEIPWYLILVNEDQPLDADFRPELAQVSYGHFVDVRIVEAASQLLQSAENAGIMLQIAASFRDYEAQRNLFDFHMAQWIEEGYDEDDSFQKTRESVAIPGASEHQAGLAIDLLPLGHMMPRDELSDTPEIQWLAENAWRYGFIMRYPYGTTHITGVMYEPWHWRYVGVEAAQEMTRLGLTLEEYLEKHFGVPISHFLGQRNSIGG